MEFFDVAIDEYNRPQSFADWFSRCVQERGLSDSQLAQQYVKLRHLMKPHDQRKTKKPNPANYQTQIKQWRTGKKIPSPENAYRIGRMLHECGLPVSGLDALIAGHYLTDLLGVVGAHISAGIEKSKPVSYAMATPDNHIFALFSKLAPRILREIAILKLELGTRNIDIDEFAAIQTPLPIEELFPKSQTALLDDGFCAWAYAKEDARQKLPPTFAAAIALLQGNPTPEIVDMAGQILHSPEKDIMSLLGFVTPRWVLRIYGEDTAPTHTVDFDSAPVDHPAIDNFLEDYESTFSELTRVFECRQSDQYPGITMRLGILHYNGGETSAIDIDWLLLDGSDYSKQSGDNAIEYLKQLASKHHVMLATFPPINDEESPQLFRRHGFDVCRGQDVAAHRRLEWPECTHEEK